MRSQFFKITIGYLIFFTHLIPAYELGAWYKRAPEIPRALNTRFDPTFLILKAGIFSREGFLKLTSDPKDWKKLCDENYKLTAWITHRLKKSDLLTVSSGEQLGQALIKNFGSTCIKAVELDIEPLKGEEIWLSDFVKKLKQTTGTRFEIRLAIPLLSENKIAGPSWKKENAKALLALIEGIDLMLYDSGTKTKQEYTALLKYNLENARQLLTEMPEKSILFGIPAYHERTQLHVDNIENIATFVAFLKTLALPDASKICTGHIPLSLYAGWTLSPEDRNSIKELKVWAEEICKKDK